MGEEEHMRILCPTCKFLESGEAHNKGISCILHNNPDKQKYFCMCEGGVTKQELRRHYKIKEGEPI